MIRKIKRTAMKMKLPEESLIERIVRFNGGIELGQVSESPNHVVIGPRHTLWDI